MTVIRKNVWDLYVVKGLGGYYMHLWVAEGSTGCWMCYREHWFLFSLWSVPSCWADGTQNLESSQKDKTSMLLKRSANRLTRNTVYLSLFLLFYIILKPIKLQIYSTLASYHQNKHHSPPVPLSSLRPLVSWTPRLQGEISHVCQVSRWGFGLWRGVSLKLLIIRLINHTD